MTEAQISQAYELAKVRYAELGVDADKAIEHLGQISISMHCWQGDDVSGFENPDAELVGGIMATGNYPGKARTPDELRGDLDKAYSLIPGKHRLNLHATYLDTDEKVKRNEIEPKHFKSWVDWSTQNGISLDFNPTCFSHPLADDGFTLAHQDADVRQFWIEHCIAARKVGASFGEAQGNPCFTNVWIPDGYKDMPVDRYSPRQRLKESLDAVFQEDLNPEHNLDAIESKLFGLGLESYTVGSHEFYMGYALKNDKVLCLDAGHFHPTETISDKLSALMLYIDTMLLHVSRGVRWDSDHVVTFTDDLQAIMQEIVRGGFTKRIRIGLDFFDASINRIAAWVIGTRNTQKALMMALLEPTEKLQTLENSGDYSSRLALLEEQKMLPFAAVWDYFCLKNNVPIGYEFMQDIKDYESTVLSFRT